MPEPLARGPNYFDIAIDTSANLANATPLDFSQTSAARITILSGESLTTLSFYAGSVGDDPEDHKYCSDIPGKTCAVDENVQIPYDIFGVHSLVIVGNNPGTARVFFKS